MLIPWHKLTKAQKHCEIVRYARNQRGSAITLNLGADFESYLASTQNPMRSVAKRMNAELRKNDLRHLPVLLVLEATKESQRLHLHGVYIGNGYSKQQLQQAMRRAVGYIDGRQGSRQFKERLLYDADGWFRYLKKDTKRTRRIINLISDDRLCWTSQAMTQRVRDEYEAVRLGHKPVANISGPLLSQI
jgi:hypothetical protein